MQRKQRVGGRVRRVARHAMIYINLQLFMLGFIAGKEFTLEIHVAFFHFCFSFVSASSCH